MQASPFAAGGEEEIVARIILFLGQPAVVERPEIAAIGVAFAVHDREPGFGPVGGIMFDWARNVFELELWIALAVVIYTHRDFCSSH